MPAGAVLLHMPPRPKLGVAHYESLENVEPQLALHAPAVNPAAKRNHNLSSVQAGTEHLDIGSDSKRKSFARFEMNRSEPWLGDESSDSSAGDTSAHAARFAAGFAALRSARAALRTAATSARASAITRSAWSVASADQYRARAVSI